MDEIRVWNRQKQCEEREAVYGENWIAWAYGTQNGRTLSERLLSKPALSKLYGIYQSSLFSKFKIRKFIDDFDIQMDEYQREPFQSFNDFFIRKFRPGVRPFIKDENRMAAFAEGRYLAYKAVSSDEEIPVKGAMLSPELLLNDKSKAQIFDGGPAIVARLCPTDYHRFHFPDSGKTLEHYSVSGKLHSVNPIALQFKREIFVTNERQVSLMETDHFGKLAYIEVGALMVGRIVQTTILNSFKKGDEKGYFLFGGSTVIVLGEPARWKPDLDLLDQTTKGRETFVKLGEGIASA